MTDMNSVLLEGSVCDTISSSTLLNGTDFVAFSVQTERDYKNAEGERKKEYSVIGCEAYGEMAKAFCRKVGNDSKVRIVGRLRQNIWTSRGEPRQSLVVIVERFELRA